MPDSSDRGAGSRRHTAGAFLLRSDDDRRRWRPEGPLLGGWGIFHAIGDPRDGTIYVAANHAVYGPTDQRSTDGGATWKRWQQIGMPEKSGMILEATWHIEPGPPQAPATLYLGGASAALFRSEDGAESWQPNRALLEHQTA